MAFDKKKGHMWPHVMSRWQWCVGTLLVACSMAVYMLVRSRARPLLLVSSALSEHADAQAREARDRGTDFLLARQAADGHWEDFEVHGGASNAWVTGAVGTLLPHSDDRPVLRSAIRKASSYLKRKRREGGWGYSDRFPEDADSTAWAVRCIARVDNLPTVDLTSYQRSCGGIATYASTDYGVWAEPHIDVTANVLLADCYFPGVIRFDRGRAIHFLVNRQNADGSWDAQWWRSPYYSTALCGEALIQTGQGQQGLLAAIGFVLRRQRSDGGWGARESNALDTALCVRLLILSKEVLSTSQDADGDPVEAGVRWLCRQQLPEGSFPPAMSCIMPPPFPVAGPATVLDIPDRRRVFSSCFAVAALDLWCAQGRRPESPGGS